MPRPEGWSDEDVKDRDACVESLMAEGVPPGRDVEERERTPRGRAYAICTTAVEERRRNRGGG